MLEDKFSKIERDAKTQLHTVTYYYMTSICGIFDPLNPIQFDRDPDDSLVVFHCLRRGYSNHIKT